MQPLPSEDAQNEQVFSSLSRVQMPFQEGNEPQLQQDQSLFYTIEDDSVAPFSSLASPDDHNDQDEPFVVPYTAEAVVPLPSQNVDTSPQAAQPVRARQRWRWSPVLKLCLIGALVLVTLVGTSLLVWSQSTSPRILPVGDGKMVVMQPTQKGSQTPSVSSIQGQGTQKVDPEGASSIPSVQALMQMGWMQAGLTQADALEALRTAATFTDREMSLDYRNMGTRQQHGGTFTSSVFLLTPGGQNRFGQQDKREINNVLYDQFLSAKMIQQVTGMQPHIVQLKTATIQGQTHQFVWVTVTFALFLSKVNADNGDRTEGLETDPATSQPLVSHMAVLLIRVAPQTQGSQAPMGGTGWLVNTYALNPTSLPVIVTDPSL